MRPWHLPVFVHRERGPRRRAEGSTSPGGALPSQDRLLSCCRSLRGRLLSGSCAGVDSSNWSHSYHRGGAIHPEPVFEYPEPYGSSGTIIPVESSVCIE